MLIFSIKIWSLRATFYFTKKKKHKTFSSKLFQIDLEHQKVFQYASDIKIKKIKVINMVSTKRNTHIIHWNIFPFSQNTLQTKSQQSYQIISHIGKKNIPNKKQSKKITKISLKGYLTFCPQVFSSKINTDFQKDRAKWQHSMVNH